MNRASQGGALFTDREDYKKFLGLLAQSTERGELIIECYCLLSTHFHLLVRSPKACLSTAMMRIQNAYVRYLNRRRGVDGPQMRGRFMSKPILSDRYESVVIRYIDFNPVEAGLATHPHEYAWGSARHYFSGTEPVWLTGDRLIDAPRGSAEFAEAYVRSFGSAMRPDEFQFVRRRMRGGRALEDELDAIYNNPPSTLAAWMHEKSRGYGSRRLWQSFASPESVRFATDRVELPPNLRRPLHAGLLRTLSACTLTEIGELLDTSATGAGRILRSHCDLIGSDREYRRLAGQAARRALDYMYGTGERARLPDDAERTR